MKKNEQKLTLYMNPPHTQTHTLSFFKFENVEISKYRKHDFDIFSAN